MTKMRPKTKEELINELVNKGMLGSAKANHASMHTLHAVAMDKGIPTEVPIDMRPLTASDVLNDPEMISTIRNTGTRPSHRLVHELSKLGNRSLSELDPTVLSTFKTLFPHNTLEIPINTPVIEPRKMTPEQQERERADEEEYQREQEAENAEKERVRAEKERINVEKKLAKQQNDLALSSTEFSTNVPKSPQEEERRREYLLYQNNKIQDLKDRRELLQNRQKEREDVELEAREKNKLNAEEQLKRLMSQKDAPREEVNKAIKAVEDANVAEITGSPRFIQEALKAKVLLGIRELNKPYEPYIGQRIPDETPEQLTAEMKLHELDPFQGETLSEHEQLKNRVRNMPGNPAMRSTQRYLDSPNQTLLQTHRDLVGDEEDEMERIYKQRAMQHLEEDILPKIRDKYAIPGVRHHGHMARDEDRAIRDYSRELNNSLSEMRLKNKQVTVPAALQHQENKTRKAQLAQTAGISDATHEIAATNALKALQDSHYAHKDKFAATMSRMGDVKQQKEAERLRLQEQEFNQRRGFDQTKLENFSNILAGHPVTSATTSTGTMPARQIQSPYSTAGQMMGAQGANWMPQQPFKKGGRVKKAIGGTLNPMNPVQDAINWSVIDRESPIDELKRDVRRQRAMGMMNMMKSRRAYAIGGGVSPIEVGAQIAEGISYKEKLKRAKEKAFEQAEQDQIRTEQPMITGALKTMSRAAARAGTPEGMQPNWLQRMGTSISGAFDDRDAEAAAFRVQRQAAIDRQLKMAEGEEASEHDARDYGLKERLAESNIAHHRAMEGIAGQRMSEEKGALSSAKQDALKLELKAALDKEIYKRNTALNLNEASKNAESGRAVGALAGIPVVGHGLASIGSLFTGNPTSPSSLQALDDASEEYFSARTPTKGRETNLAAENRRKAKAGLTKAPEYNIRQTSEDASITQGNVNALLAEYAKYASPEDLQGYVNEYKDPASISSKPIIGNVPAVNSNTGVFSREQIEAVARKRGLIQ